jgi:hypothetical protein
MNGGSISKKLAASWECPNRESHRCSLRQCRHKRKEYRRQTHLQRREIDNAKNRKRYHDRYKNDPKWTEKRKRSWREYAAKMGGQWILERSRKYRKPYASLSTSQRSRIRNAYTSWAKRNWEKRVDYARKYRRKNPIFGFKTKIAAARRSGDIRKLAEECLDAIIHLDEKSRGR